MQTIGTTHKHPIGTSASLLLTAPNRRKRRNTTPHLLSRSHGDDSQESEHNELHFFQVFMFSARKQERAAGANGERREKKQRRSQAKREKGRPTPNNYITRVCWCASVLILARLFSGMTLWLVLRVICGTRWPNKANNFVHRSPVSSDGELGGTCNGSVRTTGWSFVLASRVL